MKKLIILFFILMTGTVFSQQRTIQWTDTTSSTGKPDRAVSQAYPLPVSLYGNITVREQQDTAIIWATDTVNGAIDTVSEYASYTLTNLNTKFKVKWQLTITADSTIEVSTAIGFTAGLTFKVNTGESWTTGYLSASTFTTLYIRRHSTITGAVTWRLDIHGY